MCTVCATCDVQCLVEGAVPLSVRLLYYPSSIPPANILINSLNNHQLSIVIASQFTRYNISTLSLQQQNIATVSYNCSKLQLQWVGTQYPFILILLSILPITHWVCHSLPSFQSFLNITKMQSTNTFAKQLINSVSYNPDHSYLALATSTGFRVYSTQPFLLRRHRDFGTPLQFVELINKSNLMALVGQKQTPYTPPNRLAIFDDKRQKIIAEVNFCSKIRQVKIRLNKVVVALYNKVFLVDLFNLEIEHIIETAKFEDNQVYNLISLSNYPNNFILATPGTDTGHVSLIYLNKLTERKLKAHQSTLSAALLTHNGDKLATTSEKGNQVRIFDTKTGQMLQQVRRGNEFAAICSISFSRGGNWLAISSLCCNLQVFVVSPTQAEKTEDKKGQQKKGQQKRGSQKKQEQQKKVQQKKGQQKKVQQKKGQQKKVQQKKGQQKRSGEKQLANPKSWLFFLKGVFPYFDAEYSFCSHKYEDYRPEMKTWLGFGEEDHLLSVSNFEHFEKLEVNLRGGKCKVLERLTEILSGEAHKK